MKIFLSTIIFFHSISNVCEAKVDSKDVDEFILTVSQEHKLDEEWVKTILSHAKHQQSIIDAMNKPAEKVLKWHEYRDIFLKDDKRIKAGMAFWKEHESTLKTVSEESGIPIPYILGIIGVETYYGKIMGKHQVLDALYTLAFDYPKRAKFFTSELKHFLVLAQQKHIDPLTAKGSYAGAMGYGQFMPSSYRSYAVDFEKDDNINLLSNPKDAIASVANYLKKHGWDNNKKVAEPLKSTAFKGPYNKLKPHQTHQQIDPKSTSKELVTVLKLQNADEVQYWLGHHNFYVISRYNHSHMYVMAVHQLAEALAKAKKNEGK